MIIANVLNRSFMATQASKVWVSDITYIQTKESVLWLTTVIDLFNRKINRWSLSNTMSANDISLATWKI